MMPAALPEFARKKLAAIEVARMQAEDAMRGAQGRMNSLPRDADQLRERLAVQRDTERSRHGQLHQLVNRLNQFVMQLPASAALDPVQAASIKLKPGETLNAAIEAVRAEIKGLQAQIAVVKAAPLPTADQKALAEQYVVSLMRQAAPSVAVVGDRLRVSWRGDVASSEDAAALMAWVAPDALLRALERAIDGLPERADALPAQERLRRIGELEAALDRAERAEQALLHRAHEDGLDILPRPDVSPAAFLGVTVRSAQAQAQQVA
jgi:hypothetical protein